MLKKIWAWCRSSATIVIARAQIVAALLIEVLDQVFSIVGNANPGMFLPPRWLGIYMLASGIVTELARRRTLAPKG
jgi:hypothetical protein